MPVRLPERCGPDCIAGFRAAAVQRHLDACRLADNERRTGAVYLWGYSIEMLLKAAFFTAFRYRVWQPITTRDLTAARELAPAVGVRWAGNLHHLPSWCRLLIGTRTEFGLEYPNPFFAPTLTQHADRVYLLWRETLRYHDNVAYDHEVRAVRQSAEWFHQHAHRL